MDESVQKHLKPKLDDASRLLLKAADLIEREGWGDGDCKERGYCAYAALVKADDPDAISTSLSRDAAMRFSRSLGFMGAVTPIFRWNDSPERTKEEVVAKMRAVALGG